MRVAMTLYTRHHIQGVNYAEKDLDHYLRPRKTFTTSIITITGPPTLRLASTAQPQRLSQSSKVPWECYTSLPSLHLPKCTSEVAVVLVAAVDAWAACLWFYRCR